MSRRQQIPLGQPIPDSPHAVSVSMPTLRDVVGYEEKDPAVMAKLASGYPRFVVHPFLRQIEAYWQQLFERPHCSFWPTSSESMAQRLEARLGARDAKLIKHRGVSALRLPADRERDRQAKLFLQHVGGFLSSRQAEDYLLAEGKLAAAYPEPIVTGDPAASVRDALCPLLDCEPEALVFANNGMNAFFAAFEAVRAIQAKRRRASWVKLGWLYTDTMHILDKLSGPDADNVEALDVFDLDQLEEILRQRGDTIAGIVTEAPTNPLIQTMDLPRIRDLATRYGAYLIVDPTVCSAANVDVSPYADIIVTSLTKYAANEGDVILGAVAATRQCPEREELLQRLRAGVEPVYRRDLARLAYQIPNYKPLVDAINQSLPRIVAFLEDHPKVRRVYWPKQANSRRHFESIARSPESLGGLISFEYDGPLPEFYDKVALAKGPSFGIATTLLCPFIILAHYDLVTSEDGKRLLERAGIHPELLRLAIGAEPAEDIIAALRDALGPA